jgi:hypothetical protein
MQARHGFCRACARELGDFMTTWERDRERQARCAGPAVQRVPPDDPRPDRTVTIRGVEYLVTWDGT